MKFHEGQNVLIRATIEQNDYPEGNMIPVLTAENGVRVWVSENELILEEKEGAEDED